MTDDIQRVREAALNAYLDSTSHSGEVSVFSSEWDAFILDFAKRLQPRPEPAKKVWSVSKGTRDRFRSAAGLFADYTTALNAVAPDIIRERPDLVAAEYQRRYRAALNAEASLKYLFPELDP